MKLSRKFAVMIVALAVVASALGLTGCGKKSGPNDYDIWLYTAQNTSYYKDYSENPVLKYMQKQSWNGKQLNFNFQVPPAGTAQDDYQRMLQSGDYPTLLQSSVADPAPAMYGNGYILDLTDYVKEYMPNYSALLESNADLRNKTVFDVDGKERVLSINILNESVPYVTFGGMCYRRDWIVKYGTPANGQTADGSNEFKGGYTDENDLDSWTDNVMFPSWYDTAKKEKAIAINPSWDGTDPFFISDWEWMFDIFTKAQNALGITDSYSVSMFYPGYTWAGGLCSCFGEGGIVWYADKEGKVEFGGTSESTRAYFECLNTWYNEGWLDKSFTERKGKGEYFEIDSTTVRQGKVGMWCGVQGDLGGRIDMNDGGNTEGIFVSGCTYPVNDVYGSDACKYEQPRVMNIDTSLVGTGYYVMKGADKKDLPSLLTFLDYLYSKEGAALRTIGLSKEQLNEEGTDKTIYNKNGLSEGAYKLVDGKYVVSDVITNDSGGLTAAVNLDKFPGIQLVESVDYGYAETLEKSLQSWIQYKNSGRVWGSTAMLRMTSKDMDKAQKTHTKVLNYMEREAYKFIKGSKSIALNSADWAEWCSTLNRYGVDTISELFQPYVDKYPIAE